MKDPKDETIEALREALKAKDDLIAQLRSEAAWLRAERHLQLPTPLPSFPPTPWSPSPWQPGQPWVVTSGQFKMDLDSIGCACGPGHHHDLMTPELLAARLGGTILPSQVQP